MASLAAQSPGMELEQFFHASSHAPSLPAALEFSFLELLLGKEEVFLLKTVLPLLFLKFFEVHLVKMIEVVKVYRAGAQGSCFPCLAELESFINPPLSHSGS